jgi:hypothetical protein
LRLLDEVFTCMSRYFTPTGGEFRNDTSKLAVAGVDRPTGTVAVVGDMDARIPLSRPTVAVAVFLWSASAVAVNVNVRAYGWGKLLSVGPVYVKTLEPFAVLMIQVPNDPVSAPDRVPPDVHGPVVAFGVGFAVVLAIVYEYVHGQAVTVVVVDPLTVAVNVCTCPVSTVTELGATVTVTTFTLELPHPDITIAAAAAHTARIEFLVVRQLMDRISLIDSPPKLSAGLLKSSR